MTEKLTARISKLLFTLKTSLKPLVKLISNKKFRKLILFMNSKVTEYTYKRSILNYFATLSAENITAEQQEVLQYLGSNPATLFPYEFIKKYKDSDVQVFVDNEKRMNYVLLDSKKLYFKRGSTVEEAQHLFSTLMLVQDLASPHRYLTDEFNVEPDDIVADIGSAEGDFSLQIVDKVKKLYIFETDPELIEALTVTFEPWKDKVEIVNKYVSNKSTDNCVTLDDFFREREKPSFIKIDVEGAEYDLLQGAKETLTARNKTKVVIATYHRYNDEVIINEELAKHGFVTSFSKGYMLSIWDDVLKEPYLRRALIRATKTISS